MTTHVSGSGCGTVTETDNVIYIGDLAEVDCPGCLTRIEQDRANRLAAKIDNALTAVNQARDSLHLAQRAEGSVNATVRLNWTQVARNALTNALTELEEKP